MRADPRSLCAVALVGVLAMSGCQSTPSAPPSVSPAPAIPSEAFTRVVALLSERLDTGTLVAQSKWFSGQPVTDAAREQAVLDAADAQAVASGVDRAYVARVFADQITASKILQQASIDAWRTGTEPPPASAPDLATQVRPILDRITIELVPALGEVSRYAESPGCADAVSAAVAASTRPAVPGGGEAFDTAVASLCS